MPAQLQLQVRPQPHLPAVVDWTRLASAERDVLWDHILRKLPDGDYLEIRMGVLRSGKIAVLTVGVPPRLLDALRLLATDQSARLVRSRSQSSLALRRAMQVVALGRPPGPKDEVKLLSPGALRLDRFYAAPIAMGIDPLAAGRNLGIANAVAFGLNYVLHPPRIVFAPSLGYEKGTVRSRVVQTLLSDGGEVKIRINKRLTTPALQRFADRVLDHVSHETGARDRHPVTSSASLFSAWTRNEASYKVLVEVTSNLATAFETDNRFFLFEEAVGPNALERWTKQHGVPVPEHLADLPYLFSKVELSAILQTMSLEPAC